MAIVTTAQLGIYVETEQKIIIVAHMGVYVEVEIPFAADPYGPKIQVI